MYNDKLVYNLLIWAFFGISLSKEMVALICDSNFYDYPHS